MAQINLGTVRVENGSTTVRAIYTITLTSVTGTFGAGSTIHWGPDTNTANDTGSGVAVSYATNVLQVYRTTDLAPVVGQKIYVDASNHGTISSFATGSPPHWDTLLTGVTGTKVFSVGNSAVDATVSSATTDTLTLTGVGWDGTTANGATYGITTEFTDAVSLPMLAAGDVNPVGLVTRGFVEIDRRLKFRGALLSMSAETTVSAATDDVLAYLTTTYDTGGFVADASHGYFTIPSGVAKVRVSFGIYPKATVGGVTGVAARVKKNTASNFPGNIRLSETTWILGKPMQATSAVFSVAEGDTLKVHFNLSGADVVVDDNGYSYFAVEAVELS